jgi:hypothetical protein
MAARARGGQVGDGRVQLVVGAGLQGQADPALELLGGDPSLGGGPVQALDDALAILVRGLKLPRLAMPRG